MCTIFKGSSAYHLRLFNPAESLFHRARDDHRKHLSMEIFDAAEIENAPPPSRIKGIAERSPLSCIRCVRCVDDYCSEGIQQANRDTFATVALLEPVGDSWTKDPVDPSF